MATVAPRIQEQASKVVYGENSPIHLIEKACVRLGATESTLLLTGETGTGKEVFARLAHASSRRAGGPFVPVNCGAIPESLVESELFGYVRGAFTGATSPRKGRIALADGGTLFLDEIGELPLSMQVKLLRVLQERVFEPVGSAESVPANFRLIAATNRNLAAEVEAGRFRRDLYYRLLVCPIELPALRERRGDVAPLFRHFWARRGETRPIDAEVFARLEAHDWPGNVRELENLVERVSVFAEGPAIQLADLPQPFRGASGGRPELMVIPDVVGAPFAESAALQASEAAAPAAEARPSETATVAPPPSVSVGIAAPTADAAIPDLSKSPIDLPGLLRSIEDRYIDAALALAGGNKKAAADMLGLQRTTLVEKLRRRTRTPAPVAAGDGVAEACVPDAVGAK